jgi:hypothetical protein
MARSHAQSMNAMPEITFERTALYEEVWTMPLTRLGEKYGLSDNGIRKICNALNIPLPNGGHWAKVAAGHKVPRIPLPQEAERTTFMSRPGGEQDDWKSPEDAKWLAERIAFEERPENRITVEEKPTRWHKVVLPIRDDLREAAKEAEKAKREEERRKKHPQLRNEPNWAALRWPSFSYHGQILCHSPRSSPTRLTPLTYERGLLILNTLCHEAERRGFTVAFNEQRGRIEFKGYGGEIEVRITESLEDKLRSEKNDGERKPRVVEYKEPTGKLRLYIGNAWSETGISDDKDGKIEAKLNRVFIRVYRIVVRERERKREQEARDRAYEIEARKRAESEARQREEEARKLRDRRRRRSLVVEAKQWKTATLIREYVTHVMNSAQPAAGTTTWTDWALSVADGLDPTGERSESLQTTDGVTTMIRRGSPLQD